MPANFFTPTATVHSRLVLYKETYGRSTKA